MDTSKEYIKMCDCPEIQEKTKDDRCSFWANKLITGKYAVMCGYKLDIWLPRQDQIQDMINYCSTNFICGLYDWFIEPGGREDEFDSYEKLWLAFYMWEYHKKTWSSKEARWIKKQ